MHTRIHARKAIDALPCLAGRGLRTKTTYIYGVGWWNPTGFFLLQMKADCEPSKRTLFIEAADVERCQAAAAAGGMR